jgi:hypothetical protein
MQASSDGETPKDGGPGLCWAAVQAAWACFWTTTGLLPNSRQWSHTASPCSGGSTSQGMSALVFTSGRLASRMPEYTDHDANTTTKQRPTRLSPAIQQCPWQITVKAMSRLEGMRMERAPRSVFFYHPDVTIRSAFARVCGGKGHENKNPQLSGAFRVLGRANQGRAAVACWLATP